MCSGSIVKLFRAEKVRSRLSVLPVSNAGKSSGKKYQSNCKCDDETNALLVD